MKLFKDVTRSKDGFLYMAYYFPQWHFCPENTQDGKYYTDWRYVHACPQRSLTPTCYYNLHDPAVIDRHDQLAAKYNLGVFIFHHYWLDNRMMMNLPIDLFIQKKRKTKFMLSWDNESGWMGKQHYDSPEQHAYQLLRYFKSENYLTDANGKKPFSVYLIPGMSVKYLSSFCKFLKLHGVEIRIGTFFQKYGNNWKTPSWSEISLEFGPHTHTSRHADSNPYLDSKHREQWQGLLVNWDQTPRSKCPRSRYYKLDERGQEHGGEEEPFGVAPKKSSKKEHKAVSPAVFKSALRTMKNNIKANNPDKVITLASWNEWSEGSCLEPSLEYGNSFLEALL